MIEFSEGYKRRAAERVKQIEASLSPKTVTVLRTLSKLFDKCVTRTKKAPE